MIGKYLRQHTATGAVHGIDDELELRFSDAVQVGKAANRFHIGRLQISLLDPGLLAIRHRAGVQFVLNDFHDRRSGRAAKLGFELHPIPIPRIVAGGDDDATCCASCFDRIGNGRGRRVIARQDNRNTGTGKDF